MTVISNTSPLNYLALIELQDILPKLFGRVLIPEAVWHELRSPAAPQPVKDWLDTSPGWLDRRVVSQIPAEMYQLDPGEREAIVLAQSVDASLILLDERRGRQVARNLGLAVSGTLGILDLAANQGLVDRSRRCRAYSQPAEKTWTESSRGSTEPGRTPAGVQVRSLSSTSRMWRPAPKRLTNGAALRR
jgi:predicted nucleic acid-binding protein